MHHHRFVRNGDPLVAKFERRLTCTVEDCTNKHFGKGYCEKHYTRVKKYGNPNFTLFKGYHFNHKGYIIVSNPETKKPIAQHRLIMQEHLGRPLLKNENVHHINGDRTDNRIENLELWSKSQPSGQRIEDKIQHAICILEQYAPEALKEKTNV